jgi:hypothetical protein
MASWGGNCIGQRGRLVVERTAAGMKQQQLFLPLVTAVERAQATEKRPDVCYTVRNQKVLQCFYICGD